ncbi:response regulator [Natronospirillum operosum]|uniref:Response regulator n=1 Tax=Natronospirillum operosum TaxID=2759953 RepID=A0A4Z0WFR2_9GAMM|nr:response regulator [Natronospirillum operosum]TGG93330.1 response regulator [Natronospirillum operosum]
MRILILEDDELMAELLRTVCSAVFSGADCQLADNLSAAMELWQQDAFDLVLCDWSLPQATTAEPFLQQVRKADPDLPLVLITSHAQKHLVDTSRRLGITQFIVKPIQPDVLAARLRALFPNVQPDSPALQNTSQWRDWLNYLMTHPEQIPGLHQLASSSDQDDQLQQRSASELVRLWRADPVISTHLIRTANALRLRDCGLTIDNLPEAIDWLGCDMAAAQVLALQLFDNTRKPPSPALREAQEVLQKRVEQVASMASRLARLTKNDVGLAYTAGLLSHLGDLAVLSALARYEHHWGPLTPPEAETALAEYGGEFGNRLRVSARLSHDLRQLMGAVHKLAPDSTRTEQYLMRLAGSLVMTPRATVEQRRLAERAGLSVEMLTEVTAH